MAKASLHPSHDGSRFEIHSRTSASVPKMIVKSAHRAEITRWVQTIWLNIEFYSQQEDQPAKASEVIEKKASQSSKRAASFNSSASDKQPILSAVAALPPTDNFLSPKLQRTVTGLSLHSKAAGTSRRRERSPAHTSGTETMDEAGESLSIFEAAEKDSMLGDGEHRPASYGIPHEAHFDLNLLNIKAQIETAQQLVDSIVTPPSSRDTTSLQLARSPSRQYAVKDALRSSLATLAIQISQQNIMSQDRERYLIGRIHRETEARRLWEENMLTVAEQQEEMDRQLTEAARDNEKKRKALRQARGVLAGLGGATAPSPPAPFPDSASSQTFPGVLEAPIAATVRSSPGGGAPPTSPPSTGMARARASISNIQEVHDAVVAAGAGSDSEDGDDDEFFDAIEQNTIPNLRLHESIAHPGKERAGTPVSESEVSTVASQTQPQRGAIKEYLARNSLEPYLHVRNKLPIDDDKRPPVSCECSFGAGRGEVDGSTVWSILKSSVGKDLTKISFPVSFNECTSMLQRMSGW